MILIEIITPIRVAILHLFLLDIIENVIGILIEIIEDCIRDYNFGFELKRFICDEATSSHILKALGNFHLFYKVDELCWGGDW